MKYDAMAFLEGLFRQPSGADVDVGAVLEGRIVPDLTPADLPPDWHERWDERAAIMEYDGRLPREHAEAQALAHILMEMRRARGAPHNHT
jgi:hypothetical protein